MKSEAIYATILSLFAVASEARLAWKEVNGLKFLSNALDHDKDVIFRGLRLQELAANCSDADPCTGITRWQSNGFGYVAVYPRSEIVTNKTKEDCVTAVTFHEMAYCIHEEDFGSLSEARSGFCVLDGGRIGANAEVFNTCPFSNENGACPFHDDSDSSKLGEMEQEMLLAAMIKKEETGETELKPEDLEDADLMAKVRERAANTCTNCCEEDLLKAFEEEGEGSGSEMTVASSFMLLSSVVASSVIARSF